MGCVVRERVTANGRTIASVECPEGYGAAAFLVERIALHAKDARVVAFARQFARAGLDAPAVVQRWVQENIRYAQETGEIFQAPWVTLAIGVGDCDDHAALVATTLLALGFRVALGFVAKEGAPHHVWARVFDVRRRGWRDLETIVAAEYGEDPIAAAVRLDVAPAGLAHFGTVKPFRDILQRGALHLSGGELAYLRVLTPRGMTVDAVESLLIGAGFTDVSVFAGEYVPPDGPAEWRPDPLVATGDVLLAEQRIVLAKAMYARPESRVAPTRMQAGPDVWIHVLAAWTPETETMGALVGAPAMSLARAKAVTSDLPDEFFAETVRVARKYGMRPADLLLVLYKESGLKRWAQNIQEGRLIAAGLIQLIWSTAQAMGYSEDEWRNLVNLSETEQMRTVVDRYFAGKAAIRGGRPYPSALHVYQAIFAPATMAKGDDLDMLLYPAGSAAARQNPALAGAKGYIVLGDLERFLAPARKHERYLAAAVRAEKAEKGKSGLGGVVASLAFGAAFAAAIARYAT